MKYILNTILCVILVIPIISIGATYYVSTTGNNTNDGTTIGTAWADIQYAVSTSIVVSGDTIQIQAGTYTATTGALAVIEKSLTLIGNGQSGAGATILDGGTYGYGTDTTGIGVPWPRAIVIRNNNIVIQDMKITNFQGDQITYGGYGIVARGESSWTGSINTTFTGLVFQDITFEDSYYGIRLSRTNGAIIQRITYQVTTTIGDYGIYATLSPNAIIQDNILTNASLWFAEGSDNGQILNNTITNAPYNGIWAGIGFTLNCNSPTIQGNTINGCEEGGIVLWNNTSPAITNALISNNTVSNVKGGSDNHGGISIYDGNYSNMKITGNQSSNQLNDQPGLSFTGSVTLSSVTVINNTFTNNPAAGIRVNTGINAANLEANFNNFSGNSTYGVDNKGTGTLNATYNWWGASNGPGPVATGSGDSVSTNVSYDPWLTSLVGDSTQTQLVNATGRYIIGCKSGNDMIPVQLDVNSLTGSDNVTVAITDDTHPNAPTSYFISRYVSLTPGGGIVGINADLTLFYNSVDSSDGLVDANCINNTDVAKYDGSWSYLDPTKGFDNDIGLYKATVTGITSLSDWTVSGPIGVPVELSEFRIMESRKE